MVLRRVRRGCLILIALSGCSEPASDFPRELLGSPQALAQGRQVFLDHCALCHGEAGDGRGVRQHGFSHRPADFTNPLWRHRRTAAEVYDIVRNGKPGTSMPAWRALSDEDLEAVTVYVLSLAP